MTRTMSPIIGIALALACACTSPAQKRLEFQQRAQAWTGQPMSEYIKVHGQPSQATPLPNEGKRYLYDQSELRNPTTGRLQGTSTTAMLPGYELRQQHAQVVSPLYCRIWVEVNRDGQITSVQNEGNNCW